MSPYFYLLALMTLGGAVAAMSLRNPVHCALCLVITFVGLAGVYLGLGAQFLGLAQVLVYVGAVAILLVFVLLLTRGGGGTLPAVKAWGRKTGLATGALVALVLIGAAVMRPTLARREVAPDLPSVEDLGHALMTEYVLPLQVVGVLLTAAMIGAAILALQERRAVRPPRGGAER